MKDSKDLTDVFGPPISTYTSTQAAEDGVLVPISARDAVTRTAWEYFKEKTPMGAEPPNCWPVEMMGWFRAGARTKKQIAAAKAECEFECNVDVIPAQCPKHGEAAHEEKVRLDKVLALAKGLIGQESAQAIRSEDAGRIHVIYVDANETTLLGLRKDGNSAWCQEMYLRPNELGGVTLMLPEDN